jgi:hypothetical protein
MASQRAKIVNDIPYPPYIPYLKTLYAFSSNIFVSPKCSLKAREKAP